MRFRFDGTWSCGSSRLVAILCERFTWKQNRLFGVRRRRRACVACVVGTAIVESARLGTTLIESARIAGALISLRRCVFRRREIASSRTSAAVRASTATPSASTAPAATAAAIAASTVILSSALVAVAAAIIRARAVLLRGIVLRRKILRRGSVRVRLALFDRLRRMLTRLVHLGSCCMRFFGSGVSVRSPFGRGFLVVDFVVVCVMRDVLDLVRSRFFRQTGNYLLGHAAMRQGFAGQHVHNRGRRQGRSLHLRLGMFVTVIVVLEIFENVANVEEGVAIEPDVNESRLHSGEHAGDAAFVDTANQREFFFALNINFD